MSLAATLAAGVAASGSSAGEAVRAGAGDKVIVATSGIRSETRETVQITRKPKDRVVMSMSPRRLPDLVSGDRLDVTSELQVTLDCARPEPRCSGRPYEYDVNLAVKLVLARGAEATGGGNAVRLTREKRHVCLGRYPHREHHCVITFTGGGMRIGAEGPPCPPAECRINVVLSAHSPQAKAGNLLAIGGTPPSGEISQDRGRVNAIVYRPADQPRPQPETTKDLRTSRLPFDEDFRVVYSKRLNGLDAKDQLAAEAEAYMEVRHLPHDARATAQLILADRRTAVRPGPIARRVVKGGAEMSETNGYNCGKPRSPCRTLKVGVARLAEDARDRQGDPVPLFVNLIMASEAKHDAGFNPNHRARILDRGRLKVLRFKP
ncbi:MAG: hypothetical protein M3Y34_03095 [Actinomycetota bacterium]|nr:hypothetical protein [Actinomycetota bacterium]